MKNRRGFLLAEETLKIVIAVICIGFLVYFLTALYFNSQDKADLELAKSSLNYLTEQINARNSEAEIYNPEGWSILSWPYNDEIPLSCSNLGWSSCICICKNPWIKSSGNYLDNCDDKSVCLENSEMLMVGGDSPVPINIENPPIVLQINYDDKKITRK